MVRTELSATEYGNGLTKSACVLQLILEGHPKRIFYIGSAYTRPEMAPEVVETIHKIVGRMNSFSLDEGNSAECQRASISNLQAVIFKQAPIRSNLWGNRRKAP